MGFSQGLSGLNAASRMLESIGNNVANASTIGFKQSQLKFADVYASATGAGGQTGIGTKVAAVSQVFTNGNVSASKNPLDIAINGNGFFRLSDNGVVTYSRNGQFELNKDGFIVSSTGANLTGYPANARGQLSTGEAVPLRLNTADIAPLQTERYKTALNLDSRADALVEADFDPTDPETYTHSTSTAVYDSLGNPHVLQTYYVKTADNTWSVFATNDGVLVPSTLGVPGKIGELGFLTDGSLDAATVASMPLDVEITASGAASPFTVEVDFDDTTQWGKGFGVNSSDQNGYSAGRLTGFSVGPDGKISGRYSNGENLTLGQVVMADFNNVNGLAPVGNNQWTETAESGSPLVGAPGSGRLGTMQSSAVEESNVDMQQELVNMITAQQFYQANAQTIKAQDQVMQTLLNIR